MEAAQQADLRPFAFVAPRGGHHRLVDHRAQHVARRHDLAVFHAILHGAEFEELHGGGQPLLERRKVLQHGAVLEPDHFRKQFGSRRHQRVQADVEGLARTQARRVDHPLLELLESRRFGEIGQRPLGRYLSLVIEEDGLLVLVVFPFLDHVQFLMAQNFSSSSENSPDTWNAKPPERSSWAMSSALGSRMK